jgi:hypothetical protein
MSGSPQQSPSATLSNTICLSDPQCEWPAVQANLVDYLSGFGEIARLDASLNLVLRCILVTYFDVRNAQRALTELAGRAESFPPASHDCRVLRVSLQDVSAAAKVEMINSFSQFGEVANVSVDRATAIVEYFDIRAAQCILIALGSRAQPWMKTPQPQSNVLTDALANLAAGGLRGAVSPLAAGGAFPGTPGNGLSLGLSPGSPASPGTPGSLASGTPLPSPENRSRSLPLTALAKAALDAEVNGYAGETDMNKNFLIGQDKVKAAVAAAVADRQGNRPVRTKVTNKEFSKYDIEPDKIQRGLDHRTTVMVRNLTGQRARKDFLTFLEKCGLHDRYTFFYMPCKEHRNVHAGFAFVNFQAPADVHTLFVTMGTGIWRQVTSDPSAKVPAVSYARFQGHDELVSHFSSSAVMHEQDPDKRPIFRAATDQPGGAYGMTKDVEYYSQDGGTGGCQGSLNSPNMPPNGAWRSARPSPKSNGNKGDTELKEALHKGAEEIVAILKNGMTKPMAQYPEGDALPAYVSSMSYQKDYQKDLLMGPASIVNHGAHSELLFLGDF